MISKVVSRMLWLGRGTATMLGVAVLAAVVLGAATAALAAVPGDPFKLGRSNSIDKLSKLVGSTTGALLRVDNNGGGAALDLRVEPGNAPMTVNSGARVAALNADKLDGKNAGAFLGVNDEAADAAHADQAANADALDGLDSTAFSLSGHDHDGRYYTEGEADTRYVAKADHTKRAHDTLGIDAGTLDGKSADEIGVNGLERVENLSATDSDSPKFATATCPTGKVVVGSGYEIRGDQVGTPPDMQGDVTLFYLGPTSTHVRVGAIEDEPTSELWLVRAFAVCATAP